MASTQRTKRSDAFPDLSGCVFYRLKVIKRDPENYRLWICECACGAYSRPAGYHLLSGKSKSCGCLRTEQVAARSEVHGKARRGGRVPEYSVWHGIKRRCYKKTSKYYGLYGGRGIRMCDRWFHSFKLFYEDMGERPTPFHQIDRIDTNGNYEPANCRWATQKENQRNRRNNRLITAFGGHKDASRVE